MNPVDHLNNTVWATLRPSKIHGIGVFAIRDIAKDTTITDHSVHGQNSFVVTTTVEDFMKILPEIRSLILDRTMFLEGQKTFSFLSPNVEATLQSFMNHSDDPNVRNGIAIRDIKKDEELTEDFRDLLLGNRAHDLIREHHAKFLKL